MTNQSEPLEIKLINTSYQPSGAGLEEDLRVDAPFEDAVAVCLKPASIGYVIPAKRET